MDDATRLLRGRSQAEISERGASGDGRPALFNHRHPDRTRHASRQPDRDRPSQLMRAGVSCLMLATVACSNPISPGDHVAVGTWGGEHAAREVTADRGRIERRLRARRLRRVARGGSRRPVRRDRHAHARAWRPGARGRKAHVASRTLRVDGGRMTLTVTLTDTGGILGTFTLTQGVAGRLRKWL